MSNGSSRRELPSLQRLLGSGLAVALVSTTSLTAPALARNPDVHWTAGAARSGWTGGARLLSGDATIVRTGGSLVIDVLTQDAVVAFPRFSIRAGSSVTIDELGPSSIFVGEVLHGAAMLFGTLTANGQVVLTDPAGITVGPQASLSAAGLILSTAGLSPAALKNLAGAAAEGTLAFDLPGNPGASVANHGAIHVTGGAAFLAGGSVENDGLIAAEFGQVELAGVKTYTVDFSGDGMLRFAAATGAVDQVPAGTTSLVENDGTLEAPGGLVLMTAQAAKGVLDNVINTTGLVEATTVRNVGGTIVLSATGGGATVSGTLDASGKGAGEIGGTVEVLGDTVTLAQSARIDASGDAGGGTALIGGSTQGAGPVATATTVSAGATIIADALTSGNGGAITVWSSGETSFDGSASAQGGTTGGNGGNIETSGAALAIGSGASIATGAIAGHAGTWLLDPGDVTIASTTGAGIDTSAGPPELFQPGPGVSDATIQNSVIETALNGGTSVVISTTNAGASGNASGNIAVDAPVAWTTSAGLTVNAAGSITFGSSAATLSSTGGGAIALQAGVGSGTGSVTLGAAIATSGPVTLSSGGSSGLVTIDAPVTAGALAVTGASGIAIGSGVGTIQSSGGQTYDGAVTIASGTTTFSDSGNGAITFAGTIDGAGTLITSSGGATTFEGVVGGTTALAVLLVCGPTVFDIPNAATNAAGFSVQTSGPGLNVNLALSTIKDTLDAIEQGYIGPVTLDTNTVLVNPATFGNIEFDGTVNARSNTAAASLTVQSNLYTLFDQPVGNTTPLASLTLEGDGIMLLEAPITTAGGGQTYATTVEVENNATLTDISGGAITFDGELLGYGVGTLTLTTSGATNFDNEAGIGGFYLESLSITPTGGTTTIAGGEIYALGTQTYGNPVVIKGFQTIEGSQESTIQFLSTVDGTTPYADTLSIPDPGASFEGRVGGTVPLRSIQADNLEFYSGVTAGSLTSDATILGLTGGSSISVTNGAELGFLTLGADATVVSTAGGLIVMDNISASKNLTVFTSGTASIGVSFGATLESLTVDGAPESTVLGSITTTGAQIYTGAVAVHGTLTSHGGITFGGPVTGQALSVNGGSAVFESSANFTSFTVGAATIGSSNGSVITTILGQTYQGPVFLAGDATIAAGEAVVFAAPIDGARNLKITGSVTIFDEPVGASTPLASLTVSGPSSLSASVATTGGGQSYGGAVTIGSGTTTLGDSSNGAITFGGTINGAGTLVTSSGGATTFDGVIGGTTALGALSVVGPTVFDIPDAATNAAGFSIHTDGTSFSFNSGPLQGFGAEQGYAGAVTLDTDTVLTVTGNGAIGFGGTVDAASLGGAGLTLNGSVAFVQPVGGINPLLKLDQPGAGFTDIFASITTEGGGQNYGNNELEILGTVAFADVGGGNITFGTPTLYLFPIVGSPGQLTVATSGTTTFDGTVAAFGNLIIPSTGGTTILAGEPIVTSGGQHLGIDAGNLYFGNSVYLANNTLVSGNSIAFGSTVDSLVSPVALTVAGSAGTVSFAGAVGGRTPLSSLSVTGTTTLSVAVPGTIVTAGGGQNYGGPVTIMPGTTTLSDSGGGAITFGGTIDGAGTLISSTSGVTTFDGVIGGTTALAAIAIEGPALFDIPSNPTLFGISNLGFSVRTSGPDLGAAPGTESVDQSYMGRVTLVAPTVFDDTAASGNIVFGNIVVGVSVGGIGPTYDGAMKVMAGTTTFESEVNVVSLVVQAATLALSGGGIVSTSLGQTYAGPLTLADDVMLEAGGSIVLGGTVDGAHNLVVEGGETGGTTIVGSIGSTTPLTTLNVSPLNQALVTFDGGSVETTSGQIYGPVQLQGAETFTSLTDEVQFRAPVTGSTLSVTAATVALAGVNVAGLSITGNTVLSSGSYLVGSAAQTYTFTPPVRFAGTLDLMQPTVFGSAVTLGSDSTVDAVGAVTFDGTIDGAFNLTLDAGGTTIFGGPIGQTTPLASLTIVNPAAPPASGGSGGSSGSGLGLTDDFSDGSGDTLVLAMVDDITLALVDPPGMAVLAGGPITTTGTQIYGGTVVVGADTMLHAPGVTFASTVDGGGPPASLSILGNASFGAAVGGATPLASLAVTGTSALSAGVTTLGGGQSYGGAVTLLANAALSDSGGGPIAFSGTINGGHALTVDTGGPASFGGAIGGIAPPSSVSISGASIAFTGNIISTGDITLTTTRTLVFNGDVDSTIFGVAEAIDPASIVAAAQSSDAWMPQTADDTEDVALQAPFAALLQPNAPPLLTILPPPLLEQDGSEDGTR